MVNAHVSVVRIQWGYPQDSCNHTPTFDHGTDEHLQYLQGSARGRWLSWIIIPITVGFTVDRSNMIELLMDGYGGCKPAH